MEAKLSLKSFDSKDEQKVLVNNYLFNFSKDLKVKADNLERTTFQK